MVNSRQSQGLVKKTTAADMGLAVVRTTPNDGLGGTLLIERKGKDRYLEVHQIYRCTAPIAVVLKVEAVV